MILTYEYNYYFNNSYFSCAQLKSRYDWYIYIAKMYHKLNRCPFKLYKTLNDEYTLIIHIFLVLS